MSLSNVIGEIAGYLSPLYPTLISKIGEENIAAEDAPPRIVWVPTKDTYASAKLQKIEPRPVKTRMAGLDAHIWGADLAATEALINDTVAAIHRTAFGAYQVLAGTWLEANMTQLGRVYVLEFQIEIPMTMPTATSVVVTAVPQNAGMTFADGSTESGVPGP